jgi:pyrimidine deaminase RibD-like protein
MSTDGFDTACLEEAILLAIEGEESGNLPIVTVIAYNGEIISRGRNGIWKPTYTLNHHAEIEALRETPEIFWAHAHEMSIYSTLEPCLMCMSTILLHKIGRVLFGSLVLMGSGVTMYQDDAGSLSLRLGVFDRNLKVFHFYPLVLLYDDRKCK